MLTTTCSVFLFISLHCRRLDGKVIDNRGVGGCAEAAFPYIIENPRQLTAAQIYEEVQRVFERLMKQGNGAIEIHEWHFMHLIYEYLGIRFRVSYEELEEIEWRAASEGAVMSYAAELLDYLNASGIRTAVISNICWSGKALTNRLNRLLPHNRFEFVMASSEYILRKPDQMLFETALRKAGVRADQVWYCGDNMKADVIGAHNAGIFPVLYEGDTPDEGNPVLGQNAEGKADFAYLHLHDWREMIQLLQKLDGQEIS